MNSGQGPAGGYWSDLGQQAGEHQGLTSMLEAPMLLRQDSTQYQTPSLDGDGDLHLTCTAELEALLASEPPQHQQAAAAALPQRDQVASLSALFQQPPSFPSSSGGDRNRDADWFASSLPQHMVPEMQRGHPQHAEPIKGVEALPGSRRLRSLSHLDDLSVSLSEDYTGLSGCMSEDYTAGSPSGGSLSLRADSTCLSEGTSPHKRRLSEDDDSERKLRQKIKKREAARRRYHLQQQRLADLEKGVETTARLNEEMQAKLGKLLEEQQTLAKRETELVHAQQKARSEIETLRKQAADSAVS